MKKNYTKLSLIILAFIVLLISFIGCDENMVKVNESELHTETIPENELEMNAETTAEKESIEEVSKEEILRKEEAEKNAVNMFKTLKLGTYLLNDFHGNDLFEETEYDGQFETEGLVSFFKYKKNDNSYLAIYRNKNYGNESAFDYAVRTFDERHNLPEKYGEWGIVAKRKGDKKFLDGIEYAYNTEALDDGGDTNYYYQIATLRDKDDIIRIVWIDKGIRMQIPNTEFYFYVYNTAKFRMDKIKQFEHENFFASYERDEERGYPAFDIFITPGESDVENKIINAIKDSPNFIEQVGDSEGGTFSGAFIRQIICRFRDEKNPKKEYRKYIVLSKENEQCLRMTIDIKDEDDSNKYPYFMSLIHY